jgi:AcrR family transcriptional regulator
MASADDDHPRRRAGRANRARVLDSADQVFARQGEAGSTEEVAALAGVGIGTVFRHFPTKADLLDAVLTRRFDRLTERATVLLDVDDPIESLQAFLMFMIDEAPGKIAIGAALLGAGGTRRATARLIRHAQQAGQVRADVKPNEAYAVMAGTARALAQTRMTGAARRRAVAIVIDGLRA